MPCCGSVLCAGALPTEPKHGVLGSFFLLVHTAVQHDCLFDTLVNVFLSKQFFQLAFSYGFSTVRSCLPVAHILSLSTLAGTY